MQTTNRTLMFVLGIGLAVTAQSAAAQKVIATIPVGQSPSGIAANTVTNKIYIPNYQAGTLTVIDGATLSTTTVDVGPAPGALAVNSATNKIYVVNENAYQSGFVTVVDGLTLSTTTVTVGTNPVAVAVDDVTNKVYVVNQNDYQQNGSVTIIDGTTLSTTTVWVEIAPFAIAVNEATNKIYVANGEYPGFITVIDGITLAVTEVSAYPGPMAVNPVTNKIYVVGGEADIVTVIDGATLSTTTVAVGSTPVSIAVNSVTNKIYVADENNLPGAVTVIDGVTLSTTTVTVPLAAMSVTVNSVTNRVYVAICCLSGSVTTIDGATNSTVTIAVGQIPQFEVVVPVNNRTYVVNQGDNTVSVIDGTPPTALQYVAVSPCRVVDTRLQGGPIEGGTFRNFDIPSSNCNVPATAAAYSLNATVVPEGPLGYLTIWPAGQQQPLVSTMNSLDGRIKANAVIVPAGSGEAISVYASNTTNVVLDIDGYFAPVSGSTLAFYTLPPCRVADGRGKCSLPCSLPYMREQDVSDRMGDLLKGIYVPETVARTIVDSLQADTARAESVRQQRTSEAQQRLAALRTRMDQMYEDKLDGKIEEEFWARKMMEWREQERMLESQLSSLSAQVTTDTVLTVSRIFELANRAHFLYLTRNTAERGQLLKSLLLNCSTDGVNLSPTYRKPFDLIFEHAKTENWSGREDLNLRPPAPKAGALPGCATPRHGLIIAIRAVFLRGGIPARSPL